MGLPRRQRLILLGLKRAGTTPTAMSVALDVETVLSPRPLYPRLLAHPRHRSSLPCPFSPYMLILLGPFTSLACLCWVPCPLLPYFPLHKSLPSGMAALLDQTAESDRAAAARRFFLSKPHLEDLVISAQSLLAAEAVRFRGAGGSTRERWCAAAHQLHRMISSSSYLTRIYLSRTVYFTMG